MDEKKVNIIFTSLFGNPIICSQYGDNTVMVYMNFTPNIRILVLLAGGNGS